MRSEKERNREGEVSCRGGWRFGRLWIDTRQRVGQVIVVVEWRSGRGWKCGAGSRSTACRACAQSGAGRDGSRAGKQDDEYVMRSERNGDDGEQKKQAVDSSRRVTDSCRETVRQTGRHPTLPLDRILANCVAT